MKRFFSKFYLSNHFFKKFHTDIYDKLMVYGEVDEDKEEFEGQGDQELATARMIGFYEKIYHLLKRVYLVINNII